MDSYRREHSSRFPFKARYDSVDVHVGQEGVQVHSGSFQSSTNFGCLRLPIFGPAPKVYVLAQGSTSSGSGCFALPLGSCDLSVSPCSSPAKGGQEDKGPKDQGNPGLSSVAHSTVVGVAAGHDGGTSNTASTLQDNPGDSGQHSCFPLPRFSGGT